MKKISAYEIALSSVACALGVMALTVGVWSEILLFTGYLLATFAMMLPLAKKSFLGYFLAYFATCILATIFNAARFWEIFPFTLFFGLHPVVNEVQLKGKINRWIACLIKAVWFDFTVYLIWRLVFQMTVPPIAGLEQWILPIILIASTLFFFGYDYCIFKWRLIINRLVDRITRNKK